MKILGFDTTGDVCSAGILSDGRIIAEVSLFDKNTHSVNLMPMIDSYSGADNVYPQHTKKMIEHPYNLQRALERFERGYLRNILVLANWDTAYAAEMLGISQKTLSRKMKKYEIFSAG